MTAPLPNLSRSLVFFDLETTGLDVINDRIIQLAAIKYLPGESTPEKLVLFLNPQREISADAAAVHGITADQVKDKPTFDDMADELYAFFEDADLAGYNLNRFDIPVLLEEFDRAGIRFSMEDRKVIDVQEVFYKMEPRTLAGAYQFYCNEQLVGAHDALADVEATVAVLQGQVEKYSKLDPSGNQVSFPVEVTVASLHDFTQRPGQLDAMNRLRKLEDGTVVFNFGKYKGVSVHEVFRKEKSYYHWIQQKDFSVQVKEITKQIWETLKD